jgi:hypothetical protein
MGPARKESLRKPYISSHSLDEDTYLLGKDNAFITTFIHKDNPLATMDIRITHLM